MISLFELLKIGVGPSSSHTVGPMLAALQFASELKSRLPPERVARIEVELFGSLALTGFGHRTDRAIIAGLSGQHPRTVDPDSIEPLYLRVESSGKLGWLGDHPIEFVMVRDLLFNRTTFLPQHPNGIRCTALSAEGNVVFQQEYFSIGGGFVLDASQMARSLDEGESDPAAAGNLVLPFPFRSAEELLSLCGTHGLAIAEIVQRNEICFRESAEIEQGLDEIWAVMRACIAAGCDIDGNLPSDSVLPGGLGIRRRAPKIYRKLIQEQALDDLDGTVSSDPLRRMDWVNMFALAVNEQNAAGGRVVTAPTNGAAGVIPAVCAYYERFVPGANRDGIHEFLKTAAAIGMLYKRNASLSAAEMGCQGEVGVACSMAAAGLAAVMGGTPAQVENAAEIGMEHNLGLTCDPVAGLVQVPCIERNTMGAVKAINAARLAVLYGDGQHRVSLDKVIETMRQTGVDMQSKYKETSLGGLAVNVTVC